MSYCRWSECDVYAYDSCEGGVRFHIAGNSSLDRLCSTYNEAYQYAKKLRDEHGLDVPSHAIEALREDAIDEAERINGPNSAVADLQAENAKLVVKLNAEHIVRQNVEIENVRLRELAAHYDSALSRLCDQMQAHVDCQGCVLGKDYDEGTCAIDKLRDAARELRIEVARWIGMQSDAS